MVEDKNMLSVIVRTTGRSKMFLERAIFNIYCNNYSTKEILLIYQGIDINFLNYLSNFKNLYPDILFTIIHNNDVSSDQRAKNINLGVTKANGRFLAFLDDDDAISLDHYQKLIDKIVAEQFSWGYAHSCVNWYDAKHNYLYKKTYSFRREYSLNSLLFQYFIPFHCVVVDLGKVNKSLLKADESLVVAEDAYIIFHLASRYNPIIEQSIGAFYNNCYLEKNIGYSKNSEDIVRSYQIITALYHKIKKDNKIDGMNKCAALHFNLIIVLSEIKLFKTIIRATMLAIQAGQILVTNSQKFIKKLGK